MWKMHCAAVEFALQLDESTLPGNQSLLLACVRFIKDELWAPELLLARQLRIDIKGEYFVVLSSSATSTY